MNLISNIWTHPKTSVTGLLIGIYSIARVLSQQGITLGTAGTGTWVTLASGIATALLGLLAKDPDSQPSPAGGTAKLGGWALIALLLPATFLGGCTEKSVAQDIVNWTPTIQSAVAAVDSTAAMLDPADAPIFIAATVGFDAASNLLISQAKAYLANPSASVLAQLQTQIVNFEQQVNASLLQAARIINLSSQQHAMAAIQVVSIAVNAVLALIESISNRSAVAQMAARSTIKLSTVLPYLDEERSAAVLAVHYAEPIQMARNQIMLTERGAMLFGF